MKIKNVIAAAVFAAAAVLAGCSNALAGNSENSGTADITVACRGADLTSDAVSCTVTTTLFNAADDSVLGTCVNTLLTGTGIVYPVFTKIDLQMKVYAVITAEVSVKTDMLTYSTVVAAGRSSAEQVKKITALNVEIKKFDPATTFFVAGENPSLITAAGSDNNDGAFKTPFATLGKALDAVNTENDGSSSYTIFVDGTVNSKKSGATADEPGLGCITPTKILNLTIQSLRDTAILDASSLSGEPVLQINNGQILSQLTLKGLTLAAGSSAAAAADGVSSVCIEDSSSGSLTIDSCTVKNGTVYASSADVTLNASTISVSSAKETAVHAQKVTLSDSSVNITGIVEAAGICVNAVPQKAITVAPYVTTTGAAFGDFLVSYDSVTLDTADFPLSDTDDYYYYKNGNNVYGVMPVQELTYSGNSSGCITSSITYAGSSQDVVTSADNIGSTAFATTVDSSGQIYVLYSGYDSNQAKYCKLYTAGSSVTADITALGNYTYNPKLCVYNGTLFASFTNSDGTASSLYSADLSGGTCELAAVIDGTISNAVTSMAVTEYSGKMYVLYSYTDKNTTDKYQPVLCIAPLTQSGSAYALGTAASVSVSSSALSSADTSSFRGNVKISDMLVTDISGTKMLYLLLSDTLTSYTQINFKYPLDSRGAFITVKADEAAASLLADELPDFNHVYGWISVSQETAYPGSVSCFAATAKDYKDSYFAGPDRFIGLAPKKITMADYGIYVKTPGSASTADAAGTAGTVDIKNGKAVFDLASVGFTPSDSETSLYGYIGSVTGNTPDITSAYCDY